IHTSDQPPHTADITHILTTDRRRTYSVPLPITDVLGLDSTFYAPHDNTRLITEVREVLLDEQLDTDPNAAEIAKLVPDHPELARALVTLHQRYRTTTDQLWVLSEGRLGTLGTTGIISMPHEEVREYFYQRQLYLHELDVAA